MMVAHRSLLVVLALASLAGGASAAIAADPASAPTAAAAAAPEPPTRRERIEEIWLDARGESGRIRTMPMYLDDQPAEYRFGPEPCGRSHRLGPETLRALQDALVNAQPVRIDATPPGGDDGRRCITGVAFFAR